MRSVWATSSAAVFFLAETQAYLQGEVVQGMWDGFRMWLSNDEESKVNNKPRQTAKSISTANTHETESDDDDEDDIWLSAAKTHNPSSSPFSAASSPLSSPATHHDPQILSLAHKHYLTHLTSSLLLTHTTYTTALYTLLLSIDHFVALIHRIHTIWTSLDLEADEGVVDAFSDFSKEEVDVRIQLREVGGKVKDGIKGVVEALRDVDSTSGTDAAFENEVDLGDGEWDDAGHVEGQGRRYKPRKVGRVDRLLMKLDFGGWFDDGGDGAVGGAAGNEMGKSDDEL